MKTDTIKTLFYSLSGGLGTAFMTDFLSGLAVTLASFFLIHYIQKFWKWNAERKKKA
jgi:hypothetical protein